MSRPVEPQQVVNALSAVAGVPVTANRRAVTGPLNPDTLKHMLAWQSPGQCCRTGVCCTRIPIPVSPRRLRESYENWLRSGKTAILRSGAARTETIYTDIGLIYPMLRERCLGKAALWEGETSYIYGPCRFFEWGESGATLVGKCVMHDHKPEMCSSYPNGGAGTFKGCGYNADPEYGFTVAEITARLRSLDDDEK